MSANDVSIEVVRGRLDDARSQELLNFWAARRALSEDEARRRLPEVVCVLRVAGVPAAVSSVYAAEVPLIAGRRFWIYRSLLDPPVADQSPALIAATFRALEPEFVATPNGPIGLCLLFADQEARRRLPQATLSDPPMIYAGYLADGRQVRIAYFVLPEPSYVPDHPRWQLEADHRVEVFAEQDAVGEQDVVDFWTREGALDLDEAQRRVSEVLTVATDAAGRIAGVGTAFLRRNRQLRAEMWYYRTFVGAAHRQSNVGVTLLIASRNHLERRFVSAEDRRAIGVLFELQNQGVGRKFPEARWPVVGFDFIGENEQGWDVRVYYFQGALAPEPEG